MGWGGGRWGGGGVRRCGRWRRLGRVGVGVGVVGVGCVWYGVVWWGLE